MIKLAVTTLKNIYASRKLLLVSYLPVLFVFGAVGAVSFLVPGLSIPFLLKDVSTTGDLPFYAGAVSQFGLLLWSAAAAICFFIYFVLRKYKSARKESLNFMLFAGLLTLYLTLDDTYLLHEVFFPEYLKAIPEKLVYLLIGSAMLAFLYFNWNEILKSDYHLMFLAFGLFGVSVVLDAIPTSIIEKIYIIEKLEMLFEDGAKNLAIVTWLIFYARYGYQQISALISKPADETFRSA